MTTAEAAQFFEELSRATRDDDGAPVPIQLGDIEDLARRSPGDVEAVKQAFREQYQRRARSTFSGGGRGGDLDENEDAVLDPGWLYMGPEGGGRWTEDAAFAAQYRAAGPNMRDAMVDAQRAGEVLVIGPPLLTPGAPGLRPTSAPPPTSVVRLPTGPGYLSPAAAAQQQQQSSQLMTTWQPSARPSSSSMTTTNGGGGSPLVPLGLALALAKLLGAF